jgi:hypothetical protein
MAHLLTCDVSSADLDCARFYRADLSRSCFDKASMQECDFRDARLSGASFVRATLCDSRFGGADLTLADLRGANLRGARELTSDQLMITRTDDRTILPNGKPGPYMKHSGAERPFRRGF